jgi:DNA-binding XRE family transcriptional regulator
MLSFEGVIKVKPSEFFKERLNELWANHKAKGGTQVTLAEAAGVAQAQVSIWLKGKSLPTVDGMAALARGFGVPLDTFLPPDVEAPKLPGASPVLMPPKLGTAASLAAVMRAVLDDLEFQDTALWLKGRTNGRIDLTVLSDRADQA